jgi:hypothetical protein
MPGRRPVYRVGRSGSRVTGTAAGANLAGMLAILQAVIGTLRSALRPRASLIGENLVLRQQLAVLRRATARPRLRPIDRAFWVMVARVWSRWADRDRLSDRAHGHVQCPLRLFRTLARPAPCAARQRDGAPLRRMGRAADSGGHRRGDRAGAADPRSRCHLRCCVRRTGGQPRRSASPHLAAFSVAKRIRGKMGWHIHVIVLGERHLLRLLRPYVAYYNEDRPHMSLGRDAPVARAVQPPSGGRVVALPRVGGLHHRYSRAA